MEIAMLNEEKVRVMNRLAMYRVEDGKKYLPVSKYYRSDYIGLALIRNFFIVTIGYALAMAATAVYFGNFFVDNIHKMDLLEIGKQVGIGYLIVVGVYSVLTYLVYSVRYFKAKKSVKGYYTDLTKLEKLYEREERNAASRRNGRRF